MSKQFLETDALEDYLKIHRKKYEERLLNEKKLQEMAPEDKRIEVKGTQNINYDQLQIEKDKEYARQYYNEINELHKIKNIPTTNSTDKVFDNYTECLIDTPENYIRNHASQSLLHERPTSCLSEKIRSFFQSSVRPCIFCTPLQVMCNLIIIIMVIIFIIFLGAI